MVDLEGSAEMRSGFLKVWVWVRGRGRGSEFKARTRRKDVTCSQNVQVKVTSREHKTSVSFPDDTSTNDTVQGRLGWGFLGTIDGVPIQTPTTPQTTTSRPETPPPTQFPPLPAAPSPLPTLNFSVVQPPPVSAPSRPPSSVITGIVTPIETLPSTAASESLSVIVEPTRCECLPLALCVNQTTRMEATTRIVTRPPTGIECNPGEVYCCVEFTKLKCGLPNVVPGVFPTDGQANLGEFPWSAVILTNANRYVGGGILIDSMHVLTAAHKVARYGNGAELKIRLGDWDLSNENEPVAFLEVGIAKIVNHPKFEATTLKNDISLITLANPVSTLTRPYPQINTICMPEPTALFTGMRCRVAGWGKDQFNGQYQKIIKIVDVPVLSSIDCQTKLRTKLGGSFVLDTNSFICAGGEASKDACTGDGGTALACLRNGQYYLAGITAGGLECGNENVPGLYVNVVNYLTWILAQVNGNGGNVEGIDPRRRPT